MTEQTEVAEGLLTTKSTALASRGITSDTCARYGYGVARYNSEPVQVASYQRKGKVVSQHLRTKGKDFIWLESNPGIELFGQHLWEEGGKQLIITEGEIDCLSWAQARNLKWPVVAVPGVSSIKMVKHNLQWISSFQEIVLFFDMDEPGQAFAQQVAALLPAGRVRIGSTAPYKDSNELLVDKDEAALYATLWQAQTWRPDELVSFDEALDGDDEVRDVLTGVDLFDDLVGALAVGELIMIGAGSNIGKSALIRQLAWSCCNTMKVAYFPLEEGVRKVAKSIAAIGDFNRDNLTLFKATGTALIPAVLKNIEYLAVAEGVKVVCIDHVTSIFNQDKADLASIDSFLQDLQALALRLGVIIFYNSHVKDPDKGSYSEGAMPSSSSFRGSGMLYRIPDLVIGLARAINDEKRKHVTTMEVLKHRHEGLRVGTQVLYTIDNNRILPTTYEDNDDANEYGEDF